MNDGKEELPYFALTGRIFGCCFEVMKELGPGFQVGLLINFRRRKLEYKRLHGSEICDELCVEDPVSF